jgi:hypothetical protein
MAKMNPTIARQAIAAQRQGELLSDFFRQKGVAASSGRAYLAKWRQKMGLTSDTNCGILRGK